MNYKELDWDSNFFGKKVIRLDVTPADHIADIERILASNKFQVAYIYSQKTTSEQSILFSKFGAKCYDHKVIFRKALSVAEKQIFDDIVHFDKITPQLQTLIISSGHLSRYYLDPRFRSFQPELYKIWLDKCYKNPNAAVAGFVVDNTPVAAAAFSATNAQGHMELIAVSPAFRKQGFAGKLMTAAEYFYQQHNATEAEVVTQLDNIAACRLYERCGYTVAETVDVWHCWK